MSNNPLPPPDVNLEVEFRRCEQGYNVIPAKSIIKKTWIEWKNGPLNWQINPISKEQHDEWKLHNEFEDGYAVICGKLWHGKNTNLYGIWLDFDNWEAVLKYFGSWEKVLELAKTRRIEWHQKKFKLHYPLITRRPIKAGVNGKRNRVLSIGIEVRAENELVYCWKNKDLNYWVPIDSNEQHIMEEDELQELENWISKQPGGKGLSTREERNDPNHFKNVGTDRSLDLLQEMASLLIRNHGLLDDEQIKQLAIDYHNKHNAPYPPDKVEANWQQALSFRDAKIREKMEEEELFKGIPYNKAEEQSKESSTNQTVNESSNVDDDDIMILNIPDDMTNMLSKFEASYKYKSAIFTFSKYDDLVVVLPIDTKNWSGVNVNSEKLLEEKEVSEDDRIKLLNLFLNNANKITAHFNKQKQHHKPKPDKKQGQQQKPVYKEMSIAECLQLQEGNVRVKNAMISGTQRIEEMITVLCLRCGNCGAITQVANYKDTRPRFRYEVSRVDMRKTKCIQGCRKSLESEPYYETIPALRIELQDVNMSSNLVKLDVILFYEYTKDAANSAGEQVIVTGSLEKIKSKDKMLPCIFAGLNEKGRITNTDPNKTTSTKAIEYVNRKDTLRLSNSDLQEIRAIPTIEETCIDHKTHLTRSKTVIEKLVSRFMPSIIANEHVKKGVIYSAANTGNDSFQHKFRLNGLLVGDPGLIKSGIIRAATKLVSKSRFASAPTSSVRSLTAIIDAEGESPMLRPGPIVASSGAICSIDEISYMRLEDQGYLLNAMQEGVIPFSKRGFTLELPGSASFLLSTNTSNPDGRWGSPNTIDMKEIPLLGALKDRIDYIFIYRGKDYDDAEILDYSFKKFDYFRNREAMDKVDNDFLIFLEKYIFYCKQFDPQMNREAEIMIAHYHRDVVNKGVMLQSKNRLFNALYNTCRAVARLKQKNIIDEEDAKEVIEFYNDQLENWGQIHNAPVDPINTVIDEIIGCLEMSKHAYEFHQLVNTTADENETTRHFVRGMLHTENAKNLKKLLKHFKETVKTDSRFVQVKEDPFIIAWAATYDPLFDNVAESPDECEEEEIKYVFGKYKEVATNGHPQYQTIEQLGKFAAAADPRVDKFLGGRFKSNESTRVRAIRTLLIEDSTIEKEGNRYPNFRCKPIVENGSVKKNDFNTPHEGGSVKIKNISKTEVSNLRTTSELVHKIDNAKNEKNDFNTRFNTPQTQPTTTTKNQDVEAIQQEVPPQDISQEPVQVEKTITQFQIPPIPTQLIEHGMGNMLVFDTEYGVEDGIMYCFCGLDTKNHQEILHLKAHFHGDRTKFVATILDKLERYDILAGHNIVGEGSDFDKLRDNCKAVGLATRYWNLKDKLLSKALDTWRIFNNRSYEGAMAQVGIYYNTHSLHDISLAYLGDEEGGKFGNLTGAEIEKQPPEIQIQYCAHDARLVMKMLAKSNWKTPMIFSNISKIVKVSFLDMCKSFGPKIMGESLLAAEGYSTAMVPADMKVERKDLGGGYVITPKPGIYTNVITTDGKGMYPGLIYRWRLSSENINNCTDGCEHNPEAQIPPEIMAIINEKANSPRKQRWVCLNRRGKLAEIEHKLIEEKDRCKYEGDLEGASAYKLVANGLFGLHGDPTYKFCDYQLAETITALGRATIQGLEKKCANYGLIGVYGDTDSLFLQDTNSDGGVKHDKFIKMADERFRVELVKEREFYKLVLTRNKKNYFGILKGGKLYSKKIWGTRRNNTPLEKEVAETLSSKEMILTADAGDTQTIEKYIRATFRELEDKVKSLDETYVKNKLAYRMNTKKRTLDSYNIGSQQAQVWREVNELGNVSPKSIVDSTYFYYKIKSISKDKNGRERSVSTHITRYTLDLQTYKTGLFNICAPILEAYKLDIVALAKEFRVPLTRLQVELPTGQQTLNN